MKRKRFTEELIIEVLNRPKPGAKIAALWPPSGGHRRRFCREWEAAYGKDGSTGILENSSSFPLFHKPDDDKLSLRERI